MKNIKEVTIGCLAIGILIFCGVMAFKGCSPNPSGKEQQVQIQDIHNAAQALADITADPTPYVVESNTLSLKHSTPAPFLGGTSMPLYTTKLQQSNVRFLIQEPDGPIRFYLKDGEVDLSGSDGTWSVGYYGDVNQNDYNRKTWDEIARALSILLHQ